MVARSVYVVSCSVQTGGVAPCLADDCGVYGDVLYSPEIDCACPADGLSLPGASVADDPALLQAVRLFLVPIDDEYSAGYSPFAPAGRSC